MATKQEKSTIKLHCAERKKIVFEVWYPTIPNTELRTTIRENLEEINRGLKNKRSHRKKTIYKDEILMLFEHYGKPDNVSNEDFMRFLNLKE